jgi:hypothetical protein
MKPITKITTVFLTLALIIVIVLVGREALGGTTFRAADYDSYDECMANIPREWLLGSLERGRAEAACHHEMEQQRRRQPGS